MAVPQIFHALDPNSYQEFQELLKEYLGSDCWALEMNDQMLFNHYMDEQRNIRETILDNIIRENILENPHSNLLVYLHRLGQDSNIKIHMFQDRSLTVEIVYLFQTNTFHVGYEE